MFVIADSLLWFLDLAFLFCFNHQQFSHIAHSFGGTRYSRTKSVIERVLADILSDINGFCGLRIQCPLIAGRF